MLKMNIVGFFRCLLKRISLIKMLFFKKREDYALIEEDNFEDYYKDLKTKVEPEFWKSKTLEQMNDAEWELLCDGCGKCCLAKMDDKKTGKIAFTRVACRLLDLKKCRCKIYEHRKKIVSDCVKINVNVLKEEPRWLPKTCAYWRLANNLELPKWHPLITKSLESTHKAGMSVKNRAISETKVKNFDDEIVDWEDI